MRTEASAGRRLKRKKCPAGQGTETCLFRNREANEMKRSHMGLKVLILIFIASFSFIPAGSADQYGLYVKIIENAQGSFDEVSAGVESALKGAGWEILASHDTGVPDKCELRSRVIIFSSSRYSNKVFSYGPGAAFALPLRVGIYEDSGGINIAILNPVSINRIIIGGNKDEARKVREFSSAALNSITGVITKEIRGNVVNTQMGMIKSKAGTGGVEFAHAIRQIYASRYTDANFRKVADDVKFGILNNKDGWRLAYTLDALPEGVVIYGITKKEIETKIFSIPRKKKTKGQYSCATLSSNTAFPIELIVYREGNKTKVVTLDEAYRVKLYFQDIRKWRSIEYIPTFRRIQSEIVKMATDGVMRTIEQ
jgi:uncharacterized protein (DUF302 family)